MTENPSSHQSAAPPRGRTMRGGIAMEIFLTLLWTLTAWLDGTSNSTTSSGDSDRGPGLDPDG